VWAHSVFTHLPEWAIRELVARVKSVLADGGQFLFTYKSAQTAVRSGLKQFKYPFSFFADVARDAGMTAYRVTKVWPASQRTAGVRWGDTAALR
jgi:hypothetical protein